MLCWARGCFEWDPHPPGKLHWFHLIHGLLLLTGEGRVGVAMWQKEVCVSTSAWNCHRGAQAAAVTQLLAAALHVSSAALLQLKGSNVLPGAF